VGCYDEQALVILPGAWTGKRDDNNKIYSFHAPKVKCISKGKEHKKYELAIKVVLQSPRKVE